MKHNKLTKSILAMVAMALLAAAPLAAQDKAAKVDKVLEEQAYTLGTQAYIFGFTLNELYRSMYEIVIDPKREGKASVNEFNHIRDLATPEDDWVVTPNNDTLYSRAFLDLSGGPLVLTIPEIGDGRIFYFPFGDAYHNIFYKVTKTETGAGAAGDYALLPPGWKGLLPEGLTRVEAPTPHVWILGRTLVSPTPEDVAAVNALQDKYTISTLADWTAGKVTDFEADPGDYPVYTRKDSADPMKYFDVLNEMMRRNPPFPRDLAFVEQLRRIGLHPEQDFNPETADPAIVAGLTRAVETARAILKRRMQEIDIVNGFAAFENPSDYGIDYLNRAAAGFIGLLASDSGMTTARPGFTDIYGKPLDGSKSTYTLTFKELPPVDDFWSLTVYRKASGFLAKNPLNRYSFGDRTEGLKLGEDGSLTIQFSSDEPKEGAANWLPIPEEPFYVVLRTYYPKFAARNGTWIGPGLKPVK